MQFSKVGRRLPGSVRPFIRGQVVRYRFRGLQPADVVLVSYPKSGSTWLRFLLAQVLTGREVDYDAIRETMPPVGRQRGAPKLLPSGGRFVRTHEPLQPWRGRSDQPVIHLYRDGRDVCISYFNHVSRRGDDAELPAFVDAFLGAGVDNYGPWHEHVLKGLEFGRTTTAPFLPIRYEDFKADPVANLARTLEFLGVHPPDGRLEEVVEANRVEHMRAKVAASEILRERSAAGGTIRETRSWAEALTVEQRQRFEEVCGPALAAAGYDLSLGAPSAPTRST